MLAQSQIGRYTITLDPEALTGTVSLMSVRSLAANDDIYDLSITNFLRPDSLRIRSVARSATTLDLTYEVTHPFAAPSNLAGPATAANRADLGVAGRVCFLIDVPSATGNSYFQTAATGAPGVTNVIANTGTITEADGYYRPDGLLPGLTTTANTFPYLVLVDERGSAGARPGISNGGNPLGNYTPGTGGWQQDNIGTNRNGWTGYGVLHQGQSAVNTVRIALSALSGPLNLDTAILAKYNDPRSGANAAQKRANRLPKSPVDINAFTYRMPHGALDIERIAFLGESGSGFIANQISGSTLHFHVDDWDARAVETSEADLATDPVLGNVAAGESGPPSLAVSLPAVLGTAVANWDNGTDLQDDDSAFGGDPEQDSGVPGDSLYYTRALTNTQTSGQSEGPATGLVMAIDPEIAADTTGWRFALTPELAPAIPAPAPVTFQAFTVQLNGPSAPPTASFALLGTTILSGNPITVQASGYSDPEGDQIEVLIDWNNDGDFNDAGESGNYLNGTGGAPVNFVSPITYTWIGSDPDSREVRVHYTDNSSAPVVHPNLPFTVIENSMGCGAPWTNPPTFSTSWDITAGNWASYSFPDSATAQVEHAYSAFPVPTFNYPAAGTNAGWVAQRITNVPSYQIHRIYTLGAGHAGGLANIPLTNAPLTLGNSAVTARQVFQIEVDSLNRVFFTRRDAGIVNSNLIGPHFGNTVSLTTGWYHTGSPGFVWFDTDGGATLATDAQMNEVTTANRVVALTIGLNDDVLLVDNQNILRRYPKVSGYAEDLSAPFPINLAAGPYNIALSSRYVHGLVQSRYNGAIFILAEDTAGQEYIYRIECDGTLNNPVTGTSNPNPLALQVGDWTTLTRPQKILLDERDSTGALIGPASDAQLVLTGYMTGGHGHDMQTLTTRLEKTGGSNGGVLYLGAVNTQNNCLIIRNGSGTTTFRVYGVPPIGWQ